MKNGKKCAEVEIHLFKNSSKDTCKFKRTFNINGKKKYYVDNATCSFQKYIEIIAQFNIQIDNLCQFLPQDRVQDFAKMNPQEILVNTQMSVCSAECIEMFEKLKQLRNHQKTDVHTLVTQMNKLREYEGRLAR